VRSPHQDWQQQDEGKRWPASKGKWWETKKEEDDGEDVNATHDEYVVAEVVTMRAMKHKGFSFCEVDVGADEYLPIVTNRKGVQAGHKVVVATEGCTVAGKEVAGEHLHSEWSAGVVCTGQDMGWEGADPLMCIVLLERATPGDPAPASAKSPLVMKAAKAKAKTTAPSARSQANSNGATDSSIEKPGDLIRSLLF